MFILLSPAKKLEFDAPWDTTLPYTEAALMRETVIVHRVAKRLKTTDVAALMRLSDNLAELNRERFQDWDRVHTTVNSRPAALAFDGDVYTGLDARSWTREQLIAAQDRLGILSGLYGILRPLDLMQPYRLEMSTSLDNKRGRNLYAFWGDLITKELNKRLAALDAPFVMNLASTEYFKSVNPKTLKAPVIDARFVEIKEDKPQMMMFFAKRARGMMARWMLENNVHKISDLQSFNADDYAFDPANSTATSLTFSRPFRSMADQRA